MRPARLDLTIVRGDDFVRVLSFSSLPAGSTNEDNVIQGSTAPDNSLGRDGDYYLDVVARVGYGPRSAGVWPVGASTVIDYTGWSFAATYRDSPDDTATAAEFSVDLSQVSAGQITISLSSAQTTAFTAGESVWDLQATDLTGLITTLLLGNVQVVLDVTHA